jgi:hypothetical protein
MEPEAAGSTWQVLSEMHRTKVVYYLPLLLFAMTGTQPLPAASRHTRCHGGCCNCADGHAFIYCHSMHNVYACVDASVAASVAIHHVISDCATLVLCA